MVERSVATDDQTKILARIPQIFGLYMCYFNKLQLFVVFCEPALILFWILRLCHSLVLIYFHGNFFHLIIFVAAEQNNI